MTPDLPFATALDLVFALWLLAMGGAIGSFLNVVVYRLPAGMSLVHPGSHCPACKRPIRWHDNVPVLGWLWLAGRCRDCRSWISLRYPLVEAITAAAFLLVGMVEGPLLREDLPGLAGRRWPLRGRQPKRQASPAIICCFCVLCGPRA